jgi:acyl-CoA thioesterase-1
MPTRTPGRPSRRAFIAGAIGIAAARGKAVVTILGDSITAGYGLPAAAALPARLGQALAHLGVPAVVRGAGISGDTTADGLARVNFSVAADTDVCLVALGGNDLLQGADPPSVRASLTRIVERLKRRGIGVVIAGIAAPQAIGRAYAREFDAVFPTVASREHVALYPDLLAGVAGVARLNQADGIHPNAGGVPIIAAGLAPVIARALRGRRRARAIA